MDTNNKSNQNPIRANLDEQFQGIGRDTEQPEELKEEVFKTLETLSLFGDIVELFTTKFSESEFNLVAIVNNSDDPPPPVEDETT